MIVGSERALQSRPETPDPLAYFEAVQTAYLDACVRSGGEIQRTFRIANRDLRYRFAGDALRRQLEPALSHLRRESSETAEYDVCLWDSASTSTPLPPMPWTAHDLVERNVIRGYNDARFRAVFQPDSRALSLFDRERKRALYWVADAAAVPMHERAAPTRIPLHWCIESPASQLVHAGAVGRDTRGVILAGRGGAGKSTTAVRCLNAGLSFVGDDYIALGTDPAPYAWSVYSSAKLNDDSVRQVPNSALSISNPHRDTSEKALLFLRERYGDSLVDGLAVHAIVLPRVTNGAQSRLVPVSRAASMVTLAPGSIFYLPDAGSQAFHTIARLIKAVPSYLLEIGRNGEAIPGLILDLLSRS